MLPYTITPEVKRAILNNDCLGFDYPWQAAVAILTHWDWERRWDLSETSAQDMALLQEWKDTTLSVLN